MRTVLLGGLTLLLAGCAVPGAPQPPSLGLPQPVQDLRATRKGERVLLTWTRPLQTSDGERLKEVGVTRVCRSLEREAPRECLQPVGEVAGGQPGEQAAFVDRIPADMQLPDPQATVTYSLETMSPRGRSAGLSRGVNVPLVAVPAPPADLNARVTPEGILLSWTASPGAATVPSVYRVSRRAEGAENDVQIGEVPLGPPQAQLRDPAIEWGATYRYRVTPVTQIARGGQAPMEIEGEDSPLLEVVAEDRFPPAVPVGLEAVFSAVPRPEAPRGFVDLTWSPSMDQDVAGYNVWRREGGEWRKLNPELVKTPAYRDAQVQPGTLEYAVSAVDLRGNESERSETASEQVPEARGPSTQP